MRQSPRSVSRFKRRILLAVFRCLWLNSRPRANRRCGRPVVNRFSPGETLWFRFYRDDFDADGTLKPHRMSPPDQSMNRQSLHGRSWFVLLAAPRSSRAKRITQLYMGIVAVSVASLPRAPTHLGGNYEFRVEHAPLDHNYQHCEVRLYQDGNRLLKANKAIKKYYREVLVDRVSICLEAEVSSKAG